LPNIKNKKKRVEKSPYVTKLKGRGGNLSGSLFSRRILRRICLATFFSTFLIVVYPRILRDKRFDSKN